MLILQSVYLYGLNDRVSDEYVAEKESGVVGNKFLLLRCLFKRPNYNYAKIELDRSFINLEIKFC